MNRSIIFLLTTHHYQHYQKEDVLLMSNNKRFKVTLTSKSYPARKEVIEAVNPPQAKEFAEARFPGFKATAANQVY
jgi:L-ascorbate metabolism protein UlaG (beta-lactamase superfamily)